MADSNVNLPPGFRFDPTDEELLLHFLRRKVARLPSHHPDVIPDLDLLPYSPWELQGKAVSGGGKWYYYSRRTPHRTTDAGYWKQTGRDEAITSRSNNAKIGVKNSWMFHVGQPPEGASTNWMMHQYRLPETAAGATTDGGTSSSRRGHPKQSYHHSGIHFFRVKMKGHYIPLGQSDREPEAVLANNQQLPAPSDGPIQWSSGICACCDDMQSCFIGLCCPCYLFAKNAEFLGSGTLIGSCTTHFVLWALVNTVCCLLTEGLLLGLPGCFVACYACNYRRTLRSNYNLQEAPCGDFATHFCCHFCAVCQEYREIRYRSSEPNYPDLNLSVITVPTTQKMESTPGN
ncbi:hypothetical protein Nepgr_025565 [Nepenthes gracilis]|uniref:NAC domain-containing protein n=1 Tax=Nepenthes gracilis TaxID=150966 RepID=A0AAD3T6Q8_NEPGR|nr:hypothetical protein Nepgr_025565 [Nepenthes gracilis]